MRQTRRTACSADKTALYRRPNFLSCISLKNTPLAGSINWAKWTLYANKSGSTIQQARLCLTQASLVCLSHKTHTHRQQIIRVPHPVQLITTCLLSYGTYQYLCASFWLLDDLNTSAPAEGPEYPTDINLRPSPRKPQHYWNFNALEWQERRAKFPSRNLTLFSAPEAQRCCYCTGSRRNLAKLSKSFIIPVNCTVCLNCVVCVLLLWHANFPPG